MNGKPLLYLLAIVTVGIATEYKKVIPDNQQLENAHSVFDDSELLQLEASGSKNKKKDKIEQVKTLSQQVADGKYGLIQKELFSKLPKRSGILSYESNSEVPTDTINNLGGLNKNEIWLAEKHLIVLRGGSFPPYEKHTDSLWPPLDTYRAPMHQVKIPPNPKVPPPFPVQFSKDGPLQILGTNVSRTLNNIQKSTAYPLSSEEGFETGTKTSSGYPNSPNSSSGTTPLPIPVIHPGELSTGVSFPPSNLNETWPPFLDSLPPGAVILAPHGNQTDLYDDDDPSIYYPPPYSFLYHTDNSSVVPPGPLVPGIILPPPPNFFSLLEETTPSTTIRNSPTQRNRKLSATTSKTQTFLPSTINSTEVTTVYSVKTEGTNSRKKLAKTSTEKPEMFHMQNRTYLPARTNRPYFIKKNPQNITISQPVKQKTTFQPKTTPQSITTPSQIYLLKNEVPEEPSDKKSPILSTTSYYTTTYSTSPFNENKSKTTETKTTNKPTQYYFYEEVTAIPQHQIQPNKKYGTTEQSVISPNPTPSVRQRKPQYIYVTAQPFNTQKSRFRFIQQTMTPDTFRIHISKLQNQIHEYFTTTRTTKRPSPKPVYHYSFQAANYHSQNNFKLPDEKHQNSFKTVTSLPPKYSVQIQQALEIFPTGAPKYHGHDQTYYQNNNQKNPKHSKNYYTTEKTNYHFEEITQNPLYYNQDFRTSRPTLQHSFKATENPVHQGFYTKPDEVFFDKNTREYFNVFGKKLFASTTPLPRFVSTAPESYSSSVEQDSVYQTNLEYQTQPVSLRYVPIVTYVNLRKNMEPVAENVQIRTNNYNNVPQYNASSKLYRQKPEIVKAIEVPVATKNTQEGLYLSYELPANDDGNFYFLTPKFTKITDNSKFYYSKLNIEKLQWDEIKSDKHR